MYNIMVDVETLGVTPDSIILSIAAVKFEFGSDKYEPFSINLDPKSSKALGMVSDPETVSWWREQSPEALAAFMKNPVDVKEGMAQFIDWVGPEWRKMIWWANGANFDYPVLEWTMRACEFKYPWKYWNCRDARTLYSLCDINMKTYPRVGVHHNAIDDCLTQIKALKECMGV